MNEENTTEQIKKELKAKTISKLFKFISTLGIVICAFLKWVNLMPNATAGEICLIWATVYGLGAGTIDLNIMFDKFTGGVK
ncbi:hypothetical protein [Treponema pectinovorum]|uniref:hypothetical protein n=1 Tax=Treponema pectinovorum TaxID=164 RepID=UPI0011CABCC6|nr:hypothetical protein [Treponema pectinovorum]